MPDAIKAQDLGDIEKSSKGFFANFYSSAINIAKKESYKVLCEDAGAKNSSNCAALVAKNIDYLTPRAGLVLPAEVYKKVLTNESYIQGAVKAANKILNLFEKNKISTQDNLFDLIYSSYVEVGLDNTSAYNHSWDILAIIASGGPNVGARLIDVITDTKFDKLKIAIATLALSAPKLDSLAMLEGRLFSLPAVVKTSCDVRKPYHFWMTAYVARLRVMEGADTDSAAFAAYILQKGYEIKSVTGGRDPNRAFTLSGYSYWNNMMRVDTTFSAAAAVFGANSAKGITRELDIDSGLKQVIFAGWNSPPVSEKEAASLTSGLGIDAYKKWQKIISSDTAMKFYLNDLGH